MWGSICAAARPVVHVIVYCFSSFLLSPPSSILSLNPLAHSSCVSRRVSLLYLSAGLGPGLGLGPWSPARPWLP